MAGKSIKGLTVEIGGDTTKLGQALDKVNSKSKDLSSELGQINKLLKMDPGNTDLLAQKQKVLADAIANTAEKLDTLKEAEKQVQKQFEKGDVSEEQVRALQREIIATEKKLESYEKATKETADQIDNFGKQTKETADQLDNFGKQTKEAEEKASSFGSKAKDVASVAAKGFTAVTAAIGAALGALTACAEGTREYRTEMGKLDTAFTSAGHSSDAAKNTYQALQGVLGETDQAVEAANHLAKLTTSEQDLQKWTDICTGVYATFGASLPIEGLTEAANETAKVAKVTGPLADALNWAGVSEDAFNESLAACSSEQERQQLILETLSGLYDEAADKYRETNAEVINANAANEALTASMAEIGAEVEPLITNVKRMGASFISDLMPGIKSITGAFGDMLEGGENATQELGEAVGDLLGGIINKASELAPAIINMGVSLVTSAATAVVEKLPDLVESITGTLIKSTPQMIKGATTLLLSIVDAVDRIIPPLIEAVPQIVLGVVKALLDATPQLIDGWITLFIALIDATPLIIEQLIPLAPDIVLAVIDALLKCTPTLLSAGVKLFGALVTALPKAVAALIKALPQIGTAIINYLKQLPSKVVSIGGDIVSGLWQGIKNKANWLKNKITGWVGDVTGFLKKLFKINSPSKVTSYMGEMLSEGLAVGIEGNAEAPMKAMSNMSADVINAARTVDGVAIERQISHNYSFSSAAEVAQNSGLVTKLDQILQAIERGQILTIDSNALVGATANTMNSALGQRRILAERGAV